LRSAIQALSRPILTDIPRIFGEFTAKIALLDNFGNGKGASRSFERDPATDRSPR
jgi:hypothetical protein